MIVEQDNEKMNLKLKTEIQREEAQLDEIKRNRDIVRNEDS
jgi:hypothetical protein